MGITTGHGSMRKMRENQRGTIPQTTGPDHRERRRSWMRCAMHGLRDDEQEAAFQGSLQLDREKQARKEAGGMAAAAAEAIRVRTRRRRR